MTRNVQVSVRAAFTAAVVAGVVATVSCSSGPPAPSATSSTATPASSPSPTSPSPSTPSAALQPFDAGILRADFERTAKEVLVPGAMMLLVTPEGTLTASYGTGVRDAQRAISAEDHIRVGSVTKTWTTTAILQMVQEGKLSLDDPVSRHRPDVPNGDNITIEQLLTMRSGLFNYTETLELNSAMDTDPQRAWKPDELLALALQTPTVLRAGPGLPLLQHQHGPARPHRRKDRRETVRATVQGTHLRAAGHEGNSVPGHCVEQYSRNHIPRATSSGTTS